MIDKKINPEFEEASDSLGSPDSQEQLDDENWSADDLSPEQREQYDRAVKAVDEFVANHPTSEQPMKTGRRSWTIWPTTICSYRPRASNYVGNNYTMIWIWNRNQKRSRPSRKTKSSPMHLRGWRRRDWREEPGAFSRTRPRNPNLNRKNRRQREVSLSLGEMVEPLSELGVKA